MSKKHQRKSVSRSAALTIPELEQSKAAVLNTLASPHSRRSYGYASERFIVWYCGEPRLGFNRSVVVHYRSFLESLSLSAATINLHLTAIRRLAEGATESGWLSPELVTGIQRVKGVKRLGRKIVNWLTGNQAQEQQSEHCSVSSTLQSVLRNSIQLLGCGLRRSEVAGLRLDQLQLRESHWVIVDLVGKGGRIRTVPVPNWCKGLMDVWLRHSKVSEGKVFRRVLKNGARQDGGVTANVVWYAVKRCAKRAGIQNLAPTIFVAVAPASATDVEANSNRSSFYSATLPCKRRNAISDASRTSKKRSMIDLESQSKATRHSKLGILDRGYWR